MLIELITRHKSRFIGEQDWPEDQTYYTPMSYLINNPVPVKLRAYENLRDLPTLSKFWSWQINKRIMNLAAH